MSYRKMKVSKNVVYLMTKVVDGDVTTFKKYFKTEMQMEQSLYDMIAYSMIHLGSIMIKIVAKWTQGLKNTSATH